MPSVNEKDNDTLERCTAARDALLAALRTMPNDVESVFDPHRDVPALQRAYGHVCGVIDRAGDETDSRRPTTKPYESSREQDEAAAALALEGSVRVTAGNGPTLIAVVTDDETGRKAKYRILEDGCVQRVSLGVID